MFWYSLRVPTCQPPKDDFFERLRLERYFSDISSYLRDKYFDTVWEFHPTEIDPPKINFLNGKCYGAS